MKRLSLVMLVAFIFSLSAQAIYDPNWERPIQSADLDAEGSFPWPRAMRLTLNQRDGAEEPTSFHMVEDTGIRCVMAPCPSSIISFFTITSVERPSKSEIRYTALESQVSTPKPEIFLPAPTRTLIVTEKFGNPVTWSVELETLEGVQNYSGTPEHVVSIESAVK